MNDCKMTFSFGILHIFKGVNCLSWICIRCLEKVNPNGGLMVIYHGKKQNKSPTKQIQVVSGSVTPPPPNFVLKQTETKPPQSPEKVVMAPQVVSETLVFGEV